MTNWQEDRQKKIAEIVTDTYIICFLLVLVPVAQYLNLKLDASVSVLFLFSVSFCVLLVLAIIYTRNIAALRTDFGTSYKALDVFLVVIFIGAVWFLIHKSSAGYLEALYVVPVLVATVGFSRRNGTYLIGVVVLSLVAGNFFLLHESYATITIMDLVIGGIVVLVGWLVGQLVEIETEGRARLLGMSDQDDLTALYNHRYFQEQLRHRILAAERTGKPVSLIIFDIDYFKFYNEMHGHTQGDEVLRQVGRVLSGRGGQPAIAARTGADEFALVLPDVSSEDAMTLANVINREIEAIPAQGFEIIPGARLRVSIGVATFPEHGRSAEDILRAVDYALYKAKTASKDKVELYFNVFDSLRSEVTASADNAFGHAKVLISIIDSKDRYTFGHSERVLAYAGQVADYLGLAQREKETLLYAAYLHDIGKVEIDRELLNKAGPLAPEEWDIFKAHPSWGRDMILPFMPDPTVGLAVLHHHENYDGTGYPNGLQGEDIPYLARVLRVIDSYDAMTTDRPYKRGRNRDKALAEILACSGRQYDPEIACQFVSMMRERAGPEKR